MTSKERILCAINGIAADHIPLTTWCFGFKPAKHLRWNNNNGEVKYWYTNRLEHLHELPKPWTLEDDFNRVLAWQSLGVDDVLDVSVPWSRDPRVSFTDSVIPAGGEGGNEYYPVLVRDYQTPEGDIHHAVKKTGDEPEGWPIQPPVVTLIEDYNVPRAVKHLIADSSEVDKARFLFAPPDEEQKKWFAERMGKVKHFADETGVFVQAWTAFGMDAVIWFSGIENAILMSMMDPESFGKLIDNIAATDYARTDLAATTPGIDMICQRGWYSSTDFWSPEIFDTYVFPHLSELTGLAHKNGKKFAYVMTTGIEVLGPRLADAGVDLLYFIDPKADKLSFERVREVIGDRMAMVGGISSVNLTDNKHDEIRREVKEAIEILGPTNRFILHPVDSIFPDTPWESIETMIEAWKEFR